MTDDLSTKTTGFVLSNLARTLGLIVALHYEVPPELKITADMLQSNWQTASSSLLSPQPI